MDRDALLAAVGERLGNRRLVWSGLRGEDVEPLTDLPQLHAAYSIIGRYEHRDSIDALAHEDLTGVRPDLELYDIDDHLSEEGARSFRRAHLRTLSEASALLPYRASQFLSSIWFARRDRCLHLGLFGGHEAAFEHKPWVETSVQGLGISSVPWTYVADEDQFIMNQLLHDGPVVFRRSRTSGGEGFVLVEDPSQVVSAWPSVPEAFVSVAPYLVDSLPLNVGATVWRDGVTVHRPSVQLIGLPGCVTRPFGYCGNDFGLAATLEAELIDEIERTTVTIGRWMREHGYLGTFGIDYLLHQGRLLFTEVNPRFQGSTPASCRLSIDANEPCLMLEHVAAFLGLDAPAASPLRTRMVGDAPRAQLVLHWTGAESRSLDPAALVEAAFHHSDAIATEVRTRRDLLTDPGGVVVRLVTRDQLTSTGFDLRPPWDAVIDSWLAGAKEPTGSHESSPK